MPPPDANWTVPRYRDASLPDLLPSVLATLTGPRAEALGFTDHLGLGARLDGVRRIGVVLVDGLGYHLLGTAAAAAHTLSPGRGGAIADILGGPARRAGKAHRRLPVHDAGQPGRPRHRRPPR